MKLEILLKELADANIDLNSRKAGNFLIGLTPVETQSKSKLELFEELKQAGLDESSSLFNGIWSQNSSLPIKPKLD